MMQPKIPEQHKTHIGFTLKKYRVMNEEMKMIVEILYSPQPKSKNDSLLINSNAAAKISPERT